MDIALSAVRVAAKAARDGHYGRAPLAGVRDSKTYQRYLALTHALIGENDDSLMRGLQRIGFVKMKG
jgi:hypothetical protein